MRYIYSVRIFLLIIPVLILTLTGCGNSEPDPETATDESVKNEETEKPKPDSGSPLKETPLTEPTEQQVATYRYRIREALALVRDFRHEEAGEILRALLEETKATTLKPRIDNLLHLISQDMELYLAIHARMPLEKGKELDIPSPDGKTRMAVGDFDRTGIVTREPNGIVHRLPWSDLPPRTQYEIFGRLIDRSNPSEQLNLCVFCFLRGLQEEMTNEIDATITLIGYPDPVEKQVLACLKTEQDLLAAPNTPISKTAPEFQIERPDFSSMLANKPTPPADTPFSSPDPTLQPADSSGTGLPTETDVFLDPGKVLLDVAATTGDLDEYSVDEMPETLSDTIADLSETDLSGQNVLNASGTGVGGGIGYGAGYGGIGGGGAGIRVPEKERAPHLKIEKSESDESETSASPASPIAEPSVLPPAELPESLDNHNKSEEEIRDLLQDKGDAELKGEIGVSKKKKKTSTFNATEGSGENVTMPPVGVDDDIEDLPEIDE